MTAPKVHLVAADLAQGCTRCGSQATVQLHPHHGRLCADDMTLPPGPFRRDLADDMVEMGRPDAAFTYLLAWLTVECDRRFMAVAL